LGTFNFFQRKKSKRYVALGSPRRGGGSSPKGNVRSTKTKGNYALWPKQSLVHKSIYCQIIATQLLIKRPLKGLNVGYFFKKLKLRPSRIPGYSLVCLATVKILGIFIYCKYSNDTKGLPTRFDNTI
jgi:hypothetical protein